MSLSPQVVPIEHPRDSQLARGEELLRKSLVKLAIETSHWKRCSVALPLGKQLGGILVNQLNCRDEELIAYLKDVLEGVRATTWHAPPECPKGTSARASIGSVFTEVPNDRKRCLFLSSTTNGRARRVVTLTSAFRAHERPRRSDRSCLQLLLVHLYARSSGCLD